MKKILIVDNLFKDFILIDTKNYNIKYIENLVHCINDFILLNFPSKKEKIPFLTNYDYAEILKVLNIDFYKVDLGFFQKYLNNYIEKKLKYICLEDKEFFSIHKIKQQSEAYYTYIFLKYRKDFLDFIKKNYDVLDVLNINIKNKDEYIKIRDNVFKIIDKKVIGSFINENNMFCEYEFNNIYSKYILGLYEEIKVKQYKYIDKLNIDT